MNPNLLGTDVDVAIMRSAIKAARAFMAAPAWADYIVSEFGAFGEAQTDDELFDYIRKTHNTVYHPSCTVKMGADDDAMAPVTPTLKLKGVYGLRVADGSVMPDLITVNPCITTMMIGERCADFIRRGV